MSRRQLRSSTGVRRSRRSRRLELRAIVATRLGFQVDLDSRLRRRTRKSEFGYDYIEPSAVLKLTASRLGGGHHAVSVHARWRNLYRGASGLLYQKSSRVYEAALTYDDPLAKWSYGAGRILVRDLRGIGYLDGVVGRYHTSQQMSFGVFGGTEPDLRTSEIRGDVMKLGGFASYDSRRNEWGRVQGVLALAGSYESGEIDREFIYQQVSYARSSKLSLFESAELQCESRMEERRGGIFAGRDRIPHERSLGIHGGSCSESRI